MLNNNGFTLCHQTPLANIWIRAQQGSDSFLSDDNIPHQAFRHTATAWIGLVYYQVYRYIAILLKMSIAQRWLLLGRQTWDLHDCDCGLMVVAGTCTRAIIVSTTQYFPVVHLLQRRTVPQHSDGILGSLSGNYGSLKLATKEQLGKYSSPVARLIA